MCRVFWYIGLIVYENKQESGFLLTIDEYYGPEMVAPVPNVTHKLLSREFLRLMELVNCIVQYISNSKLL